MGENLVAGSEANHDVGFPIDDLMAWQADHKSVGSQDGAPDGGKIPSIAVRSLARLQ